MHILLRPDRAMERRPGCVGPTDVNTALEPDLVNAIPPTGKEADALRRAHDVIEMLGKIGPRHAPVDKLPDIVRRLDRQGHTRHGTQCTKADHRSVKIVLAGGEAKDIALARH